MEENNSGHMILVTGATGTTGREVVHELCKRSRRVRAIVRDPGKASSIQPNDAQRVVADLMRPEILDSALDGVHCVFLLAANTPHQVRMETNLVSAAQRAGVHRVVKLSVLGASRNSRSVIARWHREAEELVERSGMSFTQLRANFFMQNMLGFAPSIRKQGSFFLPVRNAKAGAVDVRDLAAVAAVALVENGHEGRTYTITGLESISFSVNRTRSHFEARRHVRSP